MKEYQLILTRYKDGKREMSEGIFIMANSFRDAHEKAQDIVTGCRIAAKQDNYEIADIRSVGINSTETFYIY